MKKIVLILSGAIAYIILTLVLSSYGNVYSHKKLNNAIVEVFTSRFAEVTDKKDKFYNYRFLFDATVGLPGEYIRLGGKTSVTTGSDRLNVKDWIIHGGYSADEPQLPASFRHFYDPTEPRGERYLKDLLNEFYVSWAITNPQTDHIEWAIADPDHEYNYDAGKMAFESAIEESDKDTKDENMAFAWRALGETLHMIADMGIACHVRDDAHPAALGQYIDLFGGPDPYEEVCEAIARSSGIGEWLGGSVDPAVSSFSRNSKRAITIAENLASYTNQNFFSNHTISGAKVKPTAHPEKDYDSPKLEDCEYEKSSSLYIRNIGGNAVKMCKDHSYWHPMNDFRGYPYIDKECAESQAKALAPQLVEAGVNVIRCFIPKLEVTIVELTSDSIKGIVKHLIDSEYPEELKYNGLVTIKNNKLPNDIIDEVMCEDGEFAEPIDLGDFDRLEDELYAEINIGYVYVKSEPYKDPLYKFVSVLLDGIDGSRIIETTNGSGYGSIGGSNEGFPDHPLLWSGSDFSTQYSTTVSFGIGGDANLNVSISGNLSTDMTIIEDLRMELRFSDCPSPTYIMLDFIDVPTQVFGESLRSIIPDGQGQQYVQEIVAENVTDDGVNSIKKVFWSNVRININFFNVEGELPKSKDNNTIYME